MHEASAERKIRYVKREMRSWAYVQERTSPTPHNVIVDRQTFDKWIALLEGVVPSVPDEDPNLG